MQDVLILVKQFFNPKVILYKKIYNTKIPYIKKRHAPLFVDFNNTFPDESKF